METKRVRASGFKAGAHGSLLREGVADVIVVEGAKGRQRPKASFAVLPPPVGSPAKTWMSPDGAIHESEDAAREWAADAPADLREVYEAIVVPVRRLT